MDFVDNVAVELIATTVILALGVTLKVISQFRSRARRQKSGERYASRLNTRDIAQWVGRYYAEHHGFQQLLYTVQGGLDGQESKQLAFLTQPRWHYPHLENDSLGIRSNIYLTKSTVLVDNDVLKELAHSIPLSGPDGQPWNSPLVVLRAVKDGGGQLDLGWAEYYQYLSTSGKLELETRRAMQRGGPTPLRDRAFSSLGLLANGGLGAQAVGVCACVVFPGSDGALRFLLQRRRGHVATYPGTYAVAPMFGCQPVRNDPPYGISLKHDLLREFGEELFDVPELHHATTHLRHDWFYDLQPISDLITLERDGGLHLRTLGFGFDGLNGELDIAMLCLFEAEDFFLSHRGTMRSNWEIQNIVTPPLFSQEVDQIILGDKCHPGSAFTIDLARKLLSDQR